MYNVQNHRVWAPSRVEANECGGIKMKRKFPPSSDGLAGRITPLVIFDEGTLNHHRDIKQVLPVPLKYGNKLFDNDWTFQQDNARAHIHYLTEKWWRDHFPSLIDKEHCPSNSRDLNPLDYSIWDELAERMDSTQISTKQHLIDEFRQATKKRCL